MRDPAAYAKVAAREASRELVVEVFKLTNRLPQTAKLRFGPDIRKVATAMSSYISEGSSGNNAEDQTSFLLMGYENLVELLTKIIQLRKQNVLDERSFLKIKMQIEDLAMKINKVTRPEG